MSLQSPYDVQQTAAAIADVFTRLGFYAIRDEGGRSSPVRPAAVDALYARIHAGTAAGASIQVICRVAAENETAVELSSTLSPQELDIVVEQVRTKLTANEPESSSE